MYRDSSDASNKNLYVSTSDRFAYAQSSSPREHVLNFPNVNIFLTRVWFVFFFLKLVRVWFLLLCVTLPPPHLTSLFQNPPPHPPPPPRTGENEVKNFERPSRTDAGDCLDGQVISSVVRRRQQQQQRNCIGNAPAFTRFVRFFFFWVKIWWIFWVFVFVLEILLIDEKISSRVFYSIIYCRNWVSSAELGLSRNICIIFVFEMD